MAFLQLMRSPRLSFIQTVVSLLLGGGAIMSSYWCVGKQKVPKPLCSPTKHSNCIPVPGVSNSSSIQFSWETGDDRFVFPTFHTGLFFTCEENIYTDAWGERDRLEEKCRGFYTLTPGAEKGLLGMVGHMMFMQVFQMTVSMGPEDFKPHSYGYSWAFYVAWVAFTVCMSAGVSTLNNYTKKVLMVGPRRNSGLNTCSFNFLGLMPPAPYYTPANPAVTLACPPSPPRISHLSPYYEPPSAKLAASTPRLTHSHSLPLPHSDSFPPPPSHPAPSSPFHRHSLPSPSPLPSGHQNHYQPEEDYSPL
ncbi:germ cell-specific gene 1-like protein isoform X3 [Larimichthys crocea]|uniref:germ cell-specific gene 1-like protein isoform X3 n=1 Tax=Larimichthys crocea TaxID=215358 RepID=UPI000F5DD9D4|nr:germ cell-specific gene 1-like protein isoform X3 [Larimichthys crocea]